MGLPWYRVHTVGINDPGRCFPVGKIKYKRAPLKAQSTRCGYNLYGNGQVPYTLPFLKGLRSLPLRCHNYFGVCSSFLLLKNKKKLPCPPLRSLNGMIWGVDDAPHGEWAEASQPVYITKALPLHHLRDEKEVCNTHTCLRHVPQKLGLACLKVKKGCQTYGIPVLVIAMGVLAVFFWPLNGNIRGRLYKSRFSQQLTAYVLPARRRPNVNPFTFVPPSLCFSFNKRKSKKGGRGEGFTGVPPKHVAFATSSLMASVGGPAVAQTIVQQDTSHLYTEKTDRPLLRQRQSPVSGWRKARKRVASYIGFNSRRHTVRNIAALSAAGVRASVIHWHYKTSRMGPLIYESNFALPYAHTLLQVVPYISRIIQIQQGLLQLRQNYLIQFNHINALPSPDNLASRIAERENLIFATHVSIKSARDQYKGEMVSAKQNIRGFSGSGYKSRVEAARFTHQLVALEGVTKGIKFVLQHELVAQQLKVVGDMIAKGTDADEIRHYALTRKLLGEWHTSSNAQLLSQFNRLRQQAFPAATILKSTPQLRQKGNQDLQYANVLISMHNSADVQADIAQRQRVGSFPLSGDTAEKWQRVMVGPIQTALNYVRTQPAYCRWPDGSMYDPNQHMAPKKSFVIGQVGLTGLTAGASVELLFWLQGLKMNPHFHP